MLSPVYRTAFVVSHPKLDPAWAYPTWAHLDGLAAGVGIALLARNEQCWRWLNRHWRRLGGLLAVSVAGFAVMTYRGGFSPLSSALYGYTLPAALYGSLLLFAIGRPESRFAAVCRSPVLGYFGKVSYALYIFHFGIRGLLLALIPAWSPRLNFVRVLAVTFLSLGLSICLAELSWRFLESKLIGRAHRLYKY